MALSGLRQAYKREINRIRNFIRRATKRGFVFDRSIIPEMPNRVTQNRLREIKKQTPELLYRRATYNDPVTNEQFSGTQGRYLERYRASKYGTSRPNLGGLPRETENVLNNIEVLINQFSPRPNWSPYWEQKKTNDKNMLQDLLNREINRNGRNVAARRLQNSSDDIEQLVEEILYYSDEETVQFDLVRTANIITGSTLSEVEVEELTNLEELSEIYE